MSTALREAAQQALETLEALSAAENIIWVQKRAEIEVEHLRAVLAQQDEPKGGGNLPPPLQAEPVANASSWFALVMNAAAEIEDASHCLRDEAAKRVAISGAKHYRDAANALFAATPRREWQGLSEEDMEDLLPLYSDPNTDAEMLEFAAAIEAALRSKNHD